MEQAEQGHLEIVTSAFTLAEVFKRKCAAEADELPPSSDTTFEDYLLKDFIVLVGVDREVGTYARRLLRTHSEIKKPQDAIHLATAALNNVDEFHTYDGKNLLPLNEKIARADRAMMRVCTPIAPPPGASGPLFEEEVSSGEGA
jgi:predicted nucleic acid-binding protein